MPLLARSSPTAQNVDFHKVSLRFLNNRKFPWSVFFLGRAEQAVFHWFYKVFSGSEGAVFFWQIVRAGLYEPIARHVIWGVGQGWT